MLKVGGSGLLVAVQVADVWSCGVMLFIMLAAAYPFGRPEDEQLKPTKKMHVMLQVRSKQLPMSIFLLYDKLHNATQQTNAIRWQSTLKMFHQTVIQPFN